MDGYSLKLKRNDLYTILIGLIALQDALNSSSLFKPMLEIMKYPLLGTILCFMVYLILKDKGNMVSWMIFVVFMLLGVNTAKVLSTNAILYIVILCFLSRKRDITKGAKVVLGIMGSTFLMHMSVFLFTYLFSRGSLQYLSWNGLNRYYIYYDHPNNAAKYFLFLCVLIAYLYTEKMKLSHWFCILTTMMVVYYFTYSESAYVVAILFFISIFKRQLWMKKCIDFFARYGMIIVFAISASLAFVITIPVISNAVMLLDGIGSGRFSNMFRAVQQYGISFFGQKVIFGNYRILGGYDSIYADNLTVYCMTYLGLIYIFAICILFYFAAKKLDANGKICLCIFIIFSFFENRVLGIEAYFAVIIAANALTKKIE